MLVNTPGALTLESGRGMYRSHDLFFSGQSALPKFTINASLCGPPHHLNFKKILHFQPCFDQNFSFQDANFPNVRSQDPLFFFKGNLLHRPYI